MGGLEKAIFTKNPYLIFFFFFFFFWGGGGGGLGEGRELE